MLYRRQRGENGQLRRCAGSAHEVLKNFPTFEEAAAMLGRRAEGAEWIAHEHYWVLHYTLA